jgi:GDPmannose 4,6-dehydratase
LWDDEAGVKSALITGILGQDGTYLARWLLHQGYEVHGLIRATTSGDDPRIGERFPSKDRGKLHFHRGSIEDEAAVRRTVNDVQPDEVYHLAGVTDSRRSFVIPEKTFMTITLGTLHFLEVCRRSQKAIRIFLASSCEVFGAPKVTPQTITTERRPVTPYGIAKNAAAGLAELYRNRYGQFIATGILYNHESPLRPPNYLSARVAGSVAAIRRGAKNSLTLGTLRAQRDWSDARDFVRGFHLALQAKRPTDYIFASGQVHSVGELTALAFAAAGLDYRKFVQLESAQVGIVPVSEGLCGEVKPTLRTLKWKPLWSFEQTITDMVQAELEHRPAVMRSDPLATPTRRISKPLRSRSMTQQETLDRSG